MNDHNSSPGVRVGYMLRMYPRFTQTFVVNEILELERQSVEVSIVSLKKPTDGRFHESISRVRAKADYLPEYLVEAPIRVVKAHWSALRQRPLGYARALSAALRHRGANLTDFLQAPLVLRWARKRKLRHVHVHFGTNEASVAYLAHLMGGLSYSLTLHAFDIFRDTVDRALLARKINASRFTVTVSEYNRSFMIENLPGVDAGKIRVSYNGIDLDTFKSNGAPRTPSSIFAVGRLIEKKGFIHLIRATGRLRDRGLPVKCTIVGDGREEASLKAEIKALKLREHVTLAGSQSQCYVRDQLATSTCLVLPCVRAADGNVDALPTVLLEAMASGCPCISTKVSGVPEIIEHERTGLLVAPGDDEALADAIERILQSPDLCARIARNARQRAERCFDVRRNVGRLKTWFGELVGRRSKVQGRRSKVQRLSTFDLGLSTYPTESGP